MKKENQISPKIISLSFAVLVLLSVTAFYIFAWTEPTAPPPGGNVAVPLNTGGDSQYKTGKLGASATGVDPSYGLTVGSAGIKATGNSYFEGALTVTTDITANDDIIFNGELMPDGATCANNQILQKIGADNWDCVNMPGGGITGSGTANYVSKWTAGTVLGNSQIFDNGTNVGIGTTAPARKFQVSESAVTWGMRVQTGAGYIDFGPASTGGAHIYTDRAQFYFNKPLNLVTNPSRIIAYSTYPLALNAGGSDRLTILSNGNVGIGTTNPVQRLTVAGQIAVNDNNTRIYEGSGNAVRIQTNSGYIDIGPQNTSYAHIYTDRTSGFYFNEELRAPAFYYTSDIAFKEDVLPLENSLDKILDLQGVSFTWKDNREPSIGLIAQDVEEIFPEAVSGEEGEKAVNYGVLVAPLIEAIKEQQGQINELQAEIEQLKQK